MLNNLYSRFGKRGFDLILSVLGLLLFCPLFVLISLLIRFSDRGPIFFIQNRVGREFRQIKVYKFRSMKVTANTEGENITGEDDSRVTTAGKLLRVSKLDELPQLLNVIKGEMSLVGPRPEVEEFVTLFKEDYQHILTVRPGITDFASITYRHEEKILAIYKDIRTGYIEEVLPAKILLYKKYINEMSLLTDIKIILLTIWKIFG